MNVKIISIAIFLACQSCSYKQKHNQMVKSQKEIVQDIEKPNKLTKKQQEVDIVCSGNSKLVVITEYINVEESISPYMPLIINQELDFYSNNVIIKTVTFPFKVSDIQLENKSIRANNTTICEIACLENKEGRIIYKIYGSNNFDPPHEFFGLISSNGEWLWYYYGDMHDAYDSYGNKEKYIKEFGESEINNLENMQTVCPAVTIGN